MPKDTSSSSVKRRGRIYGSLETHRILAKIAVKRSLKAEEQVVFNHTRDEFLMPGFPTMSFE